MNVQTRDYSIKIGDQTRPVNGAKAALANEIDTNHNGVIEPEEMEKFVKSDKSTATGCHDHTPRQEMPRGLVASGATVQGGDARALAKELSYSLASVPNPERGGYHSFDSLIQDFDALKDANPNYVHKESLGKTAEGRDIWAYKVSEGANGDTSNKTGIVISGAHHAREWMTVEAPLRLAKDLLSGIDKDSAKQQRLKDSEVWIVPCVNADGYEYTRNGDNMWRKNRRPVEVDQLGKPNSAIGTDLNRNYGDNDPAHAYLWRPAGDTPGNTDDDFDATSDDPDSEVYRGASAASEPETQAMLKLELGHKNIKGVIDYHSYGNDIFYPWDHTKEESPHAATYKEIGSKISAATGWTCAQGSALYLNSGDSDETQEINGMLSFCFEMGNSFQPSPSLIPKVTGQASAGTQVFIDEVIARDKKGQIPRPELAAV